jgi:hypothetical protein
MFRSTRLSNTSAKTVGSVNGSVNPLFQPYPIDSNGLYGVIGGEGVPHLVVSPRPAETHLSCKYTVNKGF